jgi:hypothetical protein
MVQGECRWAHGNRQPGELDDRVAFFPPALLVRRAVLVGMTSTVEAMWLPQLAPMLMTIATSARRGPRQDSTLIREMAAARLVTSSRSKMFSMCLRTVASETSSCRAMRALVYPAATCPRI